MGYTGPYKYKLTITGKEKARKIERKEQDGKAVNFSKPITNDKQPKIYIIKSKGEIVYVGYTSQSLSTRLSAGMRANGEKGYYGYKWKKLNTVDLIFFVFEPFIGDLDKDEEHKLFVEAIEAELVCKIRNKTGKWPEWQNEIHFNNEKREKVLEKANLIYKKVIHTS